MPEPKDWFVCPECGKRIATYNADAVCKGVFCWCKKCREEKEIALSRKERREDEEL